MNITYAGLARDLGVTICEGCGAVPNHRGGAATIVVVHWYPRRETRAGIRRFLIHAIEADDPAIARMPPWMRIWLTNTEATEKARLLGVVLPKRLSDTDRARVRAYLDGVPTDQRKYYGEVYMKASKWATR